MRAQAEEGCSDCEQRGLRRGFAAGRAPVGEAGWPAMAIPGAVAWCGREADLMIASRGAAPAGRIEEGGGRAAARAGRPPTLAGLPKRSVIARLAMAGR